MLVDTHCHLNLLDLSQYPEQLETVFTNARANQVNHMLCVATCLDNCATVLNYAKTYAGISASVGVHPNEEAGDDFSSEYLIALASNNEVVAVGETGLDYYREHDQEKIQAQQLKFKTQIAVAKAVAKPLIIHTREAREDTLRILQQEQAEQVGGVLHCFTETLAMAEAAIEIGFYISFSGIVTFKNATELQTIAKVLPLDKILIETDCPYLAPMPYRGKANQPAYVYHVAECLAELKQLPVQQIIEQTTENFFNLFTQARSHRAMQQPYGKLS